MRAGLCCVLLLACLPGVLRAATPENCAPNASDRASRWADVKDVIEGNGEFILVGIRSPYDGLHLNQSAIYASRDGLSWQTRYLTTEILQAVAWSGAGYLAAHPFSPRQLLASRDGRQWKSLGEDVPGDLAAVMPNLALDDRLFALRESWFVSGTDGLWMRAPWHDWQRVMSMGKHRQLPEITLSIGAAVDTLSAIVDDGTRLLAVRILGGLWSSPDGNRWSMVDTDRQTLGLAWDGRQFVAVGVGGRIRASADGIHWENRPSPTGRNLYAVHWNGRQFLAAGGCGTILRSPDGRDWQPADTGTSMTLTRIAWNGSHYAVAGRDAGTELIGNPQALRLSGRGVVLQSEDGSMWKRALPPTQ